MCHNYLLIILVIANINESLCTCYFTKGLYLIIFQLYYYFYAESFWEYLMYLRKSNFSRGELIPIAFRLSFTGYCLDLLELEGLRFTGLCISSAFRTSILSSNFVNAEMLCTSSSSLLSLMSIVRKRASVSLKYSEQFSEGTIT